MKILDLDKLTTSENKVFNRLALENRKKFNSIVEEISQEHENNLDWIVSSLASRNKYQSPLYRRICQIALVQELLINDGDYDIVRTNDRPLKISLIELIANLKVQVQVTCTEGLGARFWRIIRPVRQFIILTFYLLLRISARNSKEKSTMFNSEPITLLDTFVLNGEPGDGGTIYKKHYIDRYYPGIFDYLSKNEKKTTIYYPTIVGFHNPRKPFKLIRECREAFVIPDDFLMLRDYFFMLAHPFRLLSLQIRTINFLGVDIKPLLKEERLRNCSDHIGIYGLLNHQFAMRLAQAGVRVKLLIDWYENQVLDRGMIVGFHKYHPGTPIIGYQGYVIAPDLHLYVFPNQTEFNGKAVPDKVAVLGKGLRNQVKEFCPEVEVCEGPAFRNNAVWDDRKFHPEKNFTTIMIGLPISLEASKHIIQKICSIDMKNYYHIRPLRYFIKPHPTHRISTIKNLFTVKFPSYFEFRTGDFHNIIEHCDILVTNASTIALEALAKEIPVIIVGDDNGVTQNPIPPIVEPIMWNICHTGQQIATAISKFIECQSKNKNLYTKQADFIRKVIFTPVNRVTVRNFLNLK